MILSDPLSLKTPDPSRTLPLEIPGPPRAIAPLRSLRGFRFLGDAIRVGGQLFQKYGSFTTLSKGGGTNVYSPLSDCPGTVLTYEPEAMRQLARQSDIFHKFPLGAGATWYRIRNASPQHQALNHYMTGLFELNGKPHLQARQHMAPAFCPHAIASWRDTIAAITQQELDLWPIGETCNLAVLTHRLSAKILMRVLFGTEVSDREIQLLRRTLEKVNSWLGGLFLLLPYNIPGLPFHGFLQDLEVADKTMLAIAARARANAEKERTLLSLLLAAREGRAAMALDESQLLGHLIAFSVAGSETNGSALMWTLFLLSQHPDVAADLLDEATEVLGGEAPTTEQLKQMPLLDRVLKESFRLLPPSPWNARVAMQDTELCGYALPRGTEVFVSLHHTHRIPEIFDRPNVFRPERWHDLHPKSWEYAPFSAGTRTCIGQGLAWLSAKIVLPMVLQRFRLQYIPTRSLAPTGVFTLVSPQGMPVKICPQDREFQRGVGGVRGSVREMVLLPD